MKRRLERWLEAGVIDADTAARIEAFEATQGKERARTAVGRTIAAIAGLSVGIGLISVVAANLKQAWTIRWLPSAHSVRQSPTV